MKLSTRLSVDLDHILLHTEQLWGELRGHRLFITGGTGFFGCWLLESFAWANDKLDLGAEAVVLTRDPRAFEERAPDLARHPSIHLYAGDVRSFAFLDGEFSHVIHAAAQPSSGPNLTHQLEMYETIVEGTRRTLDFAIHCRASKYLLTSSGAIYGKQDPEMLLLSENYSGRFDLSDPKSMYAEGKRAAEVICTLYAAEYGLECKIARCFAFVGPYLPLHKHFAIGNFIRDGLKGRPIRVNGDGTPYRSYLYAADLVIWLWTILVLGQSCRPYNVGSEHALSIAQVAQAVALLFAKYPEIQIEKKPNPEAEPERYVPSVIRAKEELQLKEWICLPDALTRTVNWHYALLQRGCSSVLC